MKVACPVLDWRWGRRLPHRPYAPRYILLFFRGPWMKTKSTDDEQTEHLPQGLRKGTCLWRRCQTGRTSASVREAISREAGNLAREGPNPIQFYGTGRMSILQLPA